MARPRLLDRRKSLKRLSQLIYVSSHLPSHYRCAASIRRSRLAHDALTSLKYLGDHLALSLTKAQRRQALTGHYALLEQLVDRAVGRELSEGILVWQKDVGGGEPPMSIVLERSTLAPMEGELQLRFSFRTDLYVLTFVLVPGTMFGADCERALFVGGVQGRFGAREELRAVSRLNGEISPAAMLILTVQALAAIWDIDAIIGIADDEHVARSYSPSKLKFDYHRFWTDAGAVRAGLYYRVPIQTSHKPLSEISLSHRRRTKHKREAKRVVKASIIRTLRNSLQCGYDPTPTAIAAERFGGAEGDRTPDLRNAIATLSQLSYGPTSSPP